MFRWRCERLDMMSFSHPCADARRRDLANCVGCSGAIEIEREVDMAAPMVKAASGRMVAPYKLCNVKGCNKQITKQGLCWSHLKESGIDPQPGRRKQADVAVVPAVPVPASAPMLVSPDPTPHLMPEEYHMDMMLSELRRTFDARLDMWRQDLLDARTIREQAQYFVSMCTAVDNLGW